MRKLFLRWALIHVGGVSFFFALALSGFKKGVHGPPLYAMMLIFFIGFLISSYAGSLFWEADTATEPYHIKSLLKKSEHVFYSVGVLQILGLIGAMLGYREVTNQKTDDPSQAVHAILTNLGSGLSATLAGVICSLFVWVEYHYLDHALRDKVVE